MHLILKWIPFSKSADRIQNTFSIENGVIVDFEMNKVCAAGTGSFLEEQAEKLDINIEEEFQELGFQAEKPFKIG